MQAGTKGVYKRFDRSCIGGNFPAEGSVQACPNLLKQFLVQVLNASHSWSGVQYQGYLLFSYWNFYQMTDRLKIGCAAQRQCIRSGEAAPKTH